MAFQLIGQPITINNYTGDMKPTLIAKYVCDTPSDLPARVQSDYVVGLGSSAYVVSNAGEYMIQTDGTWQLQVAGTVTYTKAEIDTLLSYKANTSSVYTKTETDSLLGGKADVSNVYTITQVDNLLLPKITLTDVFGVPTGSFIPEEDGINLNGYTTRGIYVKQYSAHVSTFDNIPFDGSTDFPYTAFKLIVEYINSANNIIQTLIPLTDDCKFYKRVRMTGATGTWRAWKYFTGITR